MAGEAELKRTKAGLVPASAGWFVFTATGDGPCVLSCASSPEETQDTALAYARFPPSRPTPYRDGLLPD